MSYQNQRLSSISFNLRFIEQNYRVKESNDIIYNRDLQNIRDSLPKKERPPLEVDTLEVIRWVPILQTVVNKFNEWYVRKPVYGFNKGGRKRRATVEEITEKNINGVFINILKSVLLRWQVIDNWSNKKQFSGLDSSSVKLTFKNNRLSAFEFAGWRTVGPIYSQLGSINEAAKQVVFGMASDNTYLPNPLSKIATDLQKIKNR